MFKVPAYNFAMQRTRILRETVEAWQSDYAQTLTDQDAEEILSNASAYLNLLEKWAANEPKEDQGQ